VPPSPVPPQIAPPPSAPPINVGWTITTTTTPGMCGPGQARLNGYCVDIPT
jgi:hypothetical protein